MTDPDTRQAVDRLVAHLFRHQAGQISAVLTRRLGPHRIDLVEDIVQETLVRALRQWPFRGIPANPPAWLMQTASHLLIDNIRREKTFADKQAKMIPELEMDLCDETDNSVLFAQEIEDDLLLMMFAACHPSLSPDACVSFTLKVLCGLSTAEIARAFFAEETAVAQRVVRVKQHFRSGAAVLEPPSPSEFAARLDAVLQVLYLMFNEGYSRHSGEHLVSAELCHEAVRLARIVAGNQKTDHPSVHALLALFCFQASRLPARTDALGDLLLLESQDRSRWDRALIGEGLLHLGRAARGEKLTKYHCEAGIASIHAVAPSYADTDWRAMKSLYDDLLSIDRSAVVLLNRAVVLSMIDGPSAALPELEQLGRLKPFENFHLFFATRADFHRRLGDWRAAMSDYDRALRWTGNAAERRFLQRQIDDCQVKLS